jgi:hypothetical protein
MHPSSQPVQIILIGHLTRDVLAGALDRATSSIDHATHPVVLVVDCRQMTGYDGDARSLFVTWNKRYRPMIRRVAVITDKQLWHMVVTAMAVASGQLIRAFRSPELAGPWIHAD